MWLIIGRIWTEAQDCEIKTPYHTVSMLSDHVRCQWNKNREEKAPVQVDQFGSEMSYVYEEWQHSGVSADVMYRELAPNLSFLHW